MTVASTTNRKTFTGDNVTTSFGTSPVVFFDTADLTVFVVNTTTGASTTLTENTQCTVTGGSGSTGTVSLAGGSAPWGALATGTTLVILRDLDVVQSADFVQNDGSDAEVTEDALDKLTMMAQQLDARLDRSFVLADSDVSGASTAIPTPEASTVVGWNSAGTALQNYSAVDLNIALTTPFTLTLLDDPDAAAARTTLGFGASGGIVATGDLASGAVTVLKSADTTIACAENVGFTFAIASNALTITLCGADGTSLSATNVAKISFRSATAATGTSAVRSLTANQTLTLSSGSTFGATNTVPFRGWLVEFDDAGTPRLGVINCLSTSAGAGAGRDVTAIYPLAQFGIASSTAEGGAGAADSAQVFYTGTAVTSKAYAVLGYFTYESGLATVGTWSAVPTRAQAFGPGVPLPGQVIQVQRTPTGAVASGTTAVPFDDTIPQSNEGDQYMTQAITPVSACNVLVVKARAMLAHSAAGFNMVSAVFQDATANALFVTNNQSGSAAALQQANVEGSILANSTAATTFKLRAGSPSGATTTFNGTAAARDFGATMDSFMEVLEVMA